MSVLTEGWLVLPDRSDARQVVAGWPGLLRCLLAHPSGRPWLVGSLGRDRLILAEMDSVRVAVIGTCPVTATQLANLISKVRTLAELDTVARELPGCFHLVASLDGVVRVQGSLTGFRRVFHARIDEVPVVGDRADLLAMVACSGIDEQVLAVRVACGANAAPPVGERSFWRGVWALDPDHYLRIDSSGTVSAVRWWQPPEPEVPLALGAGAVRRALAMAVALRRPVVGRLSADLSGGMDSSSLCFLAARTGMGDLLTFRWAEADVANDDAVFAAEAANELPLAAHLVVPQAEMPSVFADVDAAADTEAPYALSRTLARVRHDASLLASHGAREHLAGHGGDELFGDFPAYLHPLLRRRPITAIRHLRGYRALCRWPWATVLSDLADRGDVGAWWHQQAQQLTAGTLSRRSSIVGWGYPLRAPEWVTPAAIDIARSVLRSTGDDARPLAVERGQHATLAALRTTGPHYRQLARVFATAGLRLQLPYLDDRVVEAGLAVRPHERTTPWRYKPLLVEAMRGILPAAITARTTKGEFSEDIRVGLRQHLPEILALFADSAIAARGLINPDLLRRQLLAPQVNNAVVFALQDLVGCETWLRAAQTLPSSVRRISVTAAAP